MTKAFKFSHKILLAAALIVVVAFAGFVAFNDYRQRQTLRSATENSMQELGTLTTRNIQSWLEGRMLLLQSMGLQIGATGTEVDKLNPVIGQPIFGSNFVLSYFGGRDGLMFSIPAGSRAADYDPRARGWYKAADAAQKTIVTEPYIAASSGKLVITVASPVQRDNKMAGIAAADIDLTTISDIINSLNFEGHGHAFILNSAGKILVHPDAKLVLKNLSDAYPNGTPQLSSSLKEVEVNGKTQFILFTQMKGISSADWYVALVLDKDAAFASLSELRTTAIIATVIAVLIIIILLSLLIGILMKPLLLMGRAMQDIADGDGDLTKRLTIQNEDEFGALGNSFNRFVERIHNSIREVSSAADQVNEVAKLVVSASNSSIRSSDQQVSRTTSVAAAINELGAAAQEIAQNAALASQHSSEANKLATDGQVTVNKTISAMNMLSEKIRDSCANIETLNDKTANIGKILEVITGISQQTNLLALNAAIEAARAGEAGRGFAVVADEVRSLAHRTQASAQQVQTMIEELQVGAKAAVSTMTESQYHSESSVGIANQAGACLNSVTQRIGEIEGMNHSVATATEEQTAVVESINVDITQINALNEQGVSNLKSTLSACSDLERQATRLKQLVDSFRI